MFSSPHFAPLMTRCRTNAHAAPIPAPINTIGRIRAATGPGATHTPTPARPAPIADGPIMINRGGHSSESEATESAAVVHAKDANATMYPAPSGLTPCKRCKKSGAYIASGLYPADMSSIIQSPAPVPDRSENASLGRSGAAARRSVRIIRANAAMVAPMSVALIARPVATLAADKSAIAPQINATRPAGKVRLTAWSLRLSAGSVKKGAGTEQAPKSRDRDKRAAPVPIARKHAADQRPDQHGDRPDAREQTKDFWPKRFGKCIAHEHIGESREQAAPQSLHKASGDHKTNRGRTGTQHGTGCVD